MQMKQLPHLIYIRSKQLKKQKLYEAQLLLAKKR
jgi:hypothetical protein